MDCFIHELPKTEKVENGVPYGVSASAHLEASASAGTSGPDGHCVDPSHRSVGAGVVTTLVPPPVTSAGRFANLTPIPFTGFDSVGSIQCSSLGGIISHADFPRFDGSNPKIWVKKCESYFDVYVVPTEYWVKLATMNFGGSAAFWMQSIEADLRKCSWEDLCKDVVGRFERD